MIISQMTAIFYFCHSFYRALKNEYGNNNGLKISLVVSSVLITLCFGLYYLAKRYLIIAKHFSNIQTLLFIVFTFELTILSQTSHDAQDGWLIIIGILSTLTTFTYSQLDSLVTFIICIIYIISRTKYWIPDTFSHIKFNIYFSLTFVIMYVFSRAYHQRERDKFCKMKNQK